MDVSSSVGIFEAKSRFSQLVALAEDGEETIVTRHGRPVARIAPTVAPTARRLGVWPGYAAPPGWDDFTDDDHRLWYEAPVTSDPGEGRQ